MRKKNPKICTGCRVSAAKIYLYHSTKIAIDRPHSVKWQTDSSFQKQRLMYSVMYYWFEPVTFDPWLIFGPNPFGPQIIFAPITTLTQNQLGKETHINEI